MAAKAVQPASAARAGRAEAAGTPRCRDLPPRARTDRLLGRDRREGSGRQGVEWGAPAERAARPSRRRMRTLSIRGAAAARALRPVQSAGGPGRAGAVEAH